MDKLAIASDVPATAPSKANQGTSTNETYLPFLSLTCGPGPTCHPDAIILGPPVARRQSPWETGPTRR
uniref:Uncharacterized protein n=1 Tax=Oryza sativa subsp. japonica TaxID=39947 RepID=Q6ZF57_ORYSJ|nr:hypothetical protein [Oryza sativa Japonica Group]